MKKQATLLLPLLLLLLLSACQREGSSSTSYQIYYPTATQDFTAPALGSEDFAPPTGEELIPALLARLLEDPQSEQLRRILPKGLLLRDYQLRDGVLRVDFSGLYGLLSGIDLTLADYSVTITLMQVSGVDTVITTIEGDRISYRDRETLRADDVFFAPELEEQPPS